MLLGSALCCVKWFIWFLFVSEILNTFAAWSKSYLPLNRQKKKTPVLNEYHVLEQQQQQQNGEEKTHFGRSLLVMKDWKRIYETAHKVEKKDFLMTNHNHIEKLMNKKYIFQSIFKIEKWS